MEDLDCGPHLTTLPMNSMIASLNISIIDDQDKESDEKFTARIIIGGDESSSAGFTLGPMSSISITVKDNEGDVGCTPLC